MLKKNFTRENLVKSINKNIGFSKNLSSSIVDDFFENVITEIIKNSKLKISSFGTFTVKNKKERVGRNPKTKVESKIHSRKVVTFKPSLLLKKKINQ